MNRKKAIEYIRWYFTEDDGMAADASVKEAIQVLVPELKESEDERIRKGLISYLKIDMESNPCQAPQFYAAAIAYLEKQKEPSMSAEEVLIKAGLKPYKDGNKWCILAGDNIQEGICGFGDTIDEALYQFLMEVCEKQKEQKPAEWSEEDSERYISIGTVLEVSTLLSKEEYDADMTWLRELVNAKKFSGQRAKQEWSEEEIVNWLKENFHVSSFDNTKIVTKFSSMDDLIKSFHKRFKSLLSRPKLSDNWKPTEEQLHALYLASYGGELSSEDCLELDSLLIDLKKTIIYDTCRTN